MKQHKFYILLLVGLVVLLQGCQLKDPENESPANQVLVSWEKITSLVISPALIDQFLASYPQFDSSSIQAATQFVPEVYRVVYKTTLNGAEVQASGACVIPVTDAASPVISYQHGTIFLNSQAPSRSTSMLTISPDMAYSLILSACGFVCSVPDYIGYGTSSHLLHPYHHHASLATASVDLLRAIKELCNELDVRLRNEHYLLGYSEGGFATLGLLKKIQEAHSAEFAVKAASAGAGAYDLGSTAENLMLETNLTSPSYPSFLFTAFDTVYDWNRSLTEIFQSPYAERIQNGLLAGDHAKSEIDNLLTNITANLFTPAFRSDFLGSGEIALKDALTANNLHHGWAPTIPTRLYHGTNDTTVPLANTQDAYDGFIANGATAVEVYLIAGEDHDGAILTWALESIQWFLELRNQ